MKAVARRAQAPAARVPRARPSGVHERQAERAGRRFARGERGLGGLLTPITAAAFAAPDSAGVPLPVLLRTDLEAAFAADLGAVRVHRDEAGARAARAFSARAFATGAHIYFDRGRFRPDAPGGRELIAHEIAHVLQQTARADEDGRIEARMVTGSGPVQCAPDDEHADEHVTFLSSGSEALKALIERHAKSKDADETLKRLIELVTIESGGRLPRQTTSAIGTRLIEIAQANEFTVIIAGTDDTFELTTPAKGFLIDCLKVCGQSEHFEAAALLLDTDASFAVKAAFGPRTDFRNYLLANKGEDWIAAAFAHPALRPIWPGVFLNTFKQYALNPGRPRQTLYFFAEAKQRELANIDGTTSDLIVSDRVAMAFTLIEKYDGVRLALFKALDDAYAKRGIHVDMPTQRMTAASVMEEFLGVLQGQAETRFWRDMLARMRSIAADAASFWQDVSALREGYNKAIDALGWDILKGRSSLKRVFPTDDPLLGRLHALLNTLHEPDGLYGLDAGGLLNLPAAPEYERRQRTLADTLGVRSNPKGNVLLELQTRLIELYDADASRLRTDLARAIGLTIWWLLDFKPVLLDYAAAKDADAKRGFGDRRLLHRIKVAIAVLRFAHIAGWDDTVTGSARIVRGDDVPSSYLVTQGWEVQHDVDVSKMVDDFGTQPLSDQHSFTADNVVRFFHADMLRQMTDALLQHIDAVKAGKAKLSVAEINRTIREAGRPWRCVPIEPMLIAKPDDLKPLADGGLNPKYPHAYNLITNSPKSMAELAQLAVDRKLGPNAYYTAPREENQPLFAWIYPDIARLIRHLRVSEPFVTHSTAAGLDALPDKEWAQEMLKRMTEGQFKAAVNQDLKTYAEGEEIAAESALREFTVLNRRDTRGRIAARLKRYADDRTVVNFMIPKEVVDAIDRFRLEVRPEVDALAQTSMLILSLGPDLDAAFDEVHHATRIPPFFHERLTRTLKFTDDELARAVKGESPYAEELKPLLFVKELGVQTPGEDEHLPDFQQHRDRIAVVAGRIEAARALIQESMGLTSDDGVTLKSLSFYPRIKPGRNHAFELDGDEWELVQVHRTFTYHPPLELSAATEKSSKPILKNASGREVTPDSGVLISFLVNGLERDVTADDTYTLTRLSHRIADVGFSREMENLAEAIETGAMVVVDIVELVPGVGQKLMLARLTAQTAAFLAVELPQLADAVKKDPVAFIEEIASKIASEHLTLENFLRFVVLGSTGSAAPFDRIRRPKPQRRFKTSPRGRLGRMIAMLRKLGMRLADALQWLQVRVRGPMRALQSAVATRPQLAWLLRRAIDIASWVRQLVPPGAAPDASQQQERMLGALQNLLPGDTELPPNASPAEQEAHARGLIARVEDQIKSSGAEFKAQLEAKLEVLREAQLPAEVVPLELLSAFILDFFLSRLGAKVRIAKSLLKHTQPYRDLEGAISGALADQVRGTDVDPNRFWRERVLDSIDEQFVQARNGLIAAVYGITDRVFEETGIAAFKLDRPAARSRADFGVQRVPFPKEELELAPRVEGEVPPYGRLAELPTSAGQPLAARVRLAEEARFGHDFRHVRVHDGEETRGPLAGLHADAAAAGSHVFLRPGLTPEHGEGARLLRHELTHVLQQAGPRPLGGDHATEPVRGRRNGTLLIDDLREAAARAMARADSAVAREPLEVEAGNEGIQPSLESVAVDLLKSLTELGTMEPTAGAVDAKDPAVTAGIGIWMAVRRRLKEKKDSDYVACFQPVAMEIAKHAELIDLSPYMKAVGALAQKPLKGARGRRPKTELDVPRFVTLLEALIFRKTGLAMQLKVKDGSPPVLQDVKVTYLHLGWILPGGVGKTPLWDKVMSTPGLVAGDDPAALRLELHARLAVMAPEPFIWKTSRREYRFSEDFVEAFAKLRANRRKDLTKDLPPEGPAPPEDPGIVPTFKNEYLNPSTQKGIGLRIGLHGGHVVEKQAGLDRESHHTTQYLLVQFFRNDNRVPAWTAGNDDPGIQPKHGKGRRYVQSKTTGRLELEDLDKGGPGKRGSHMPAILIAADTHRRGQLHVGRATQWNGPDDPDSSDAQGRATQGYAISAEWKRQLIEQFGTHHAADDWKTRISKTPDAADKIHVAMTRTYHWMHRQMMPALESGLKLRELAYYRSVASRKPNAVDRSGKLNTKYDLESSELHAVFARARRHNNEVMAAAGWKAPS